MKCPLLRLSTERSCSIRTVQGRKRPLRTLNPQPSNLHDPAPAFPRPTGNPHEGGGTAGQGQDHHMRDDLRSVPPMTDSLFLLTEDEADTAALDNLSSDYRQFLKEFLNDDF